MNRIGLLIRGSKMQEKKIPLTSAEIASLWTSYMNNYATLANGAI